MPLIPLLGVVYVAKSSVGPYLTGFEIALLVIAILELLIIIWDVFIADDPTEEQLDDIRRREEEIREKLQNQEIHNQQLQQQLDRMERALNALNEAHGGK